MTGVAVVVAVGVGVRVCMAVGVLMAVAVDAYTSGGKSCRSGVVPDADARFLHRSHDRGCGRG